MKKELQGEAVIATSGGVDSTVAAVLAHKALDKKLHYIYVDTGYMRKGEPKEVKELFGELRVEIDVVDAIKKFYSALEGIVDPEKKRKIIGETFIRVFGKKLRKGCKVLNLYLEKPQQLNQQVFYSLNQKNY